MARSLFPGMDPYLEPHWLDVHTSLVSGARDALNERLPEDLIASAEKRVAVESESGEERLVGPDVRVFEPPAGATMAVEAPTAAVVAMPVRLVAQVEPVTERYVRIIEAGTERLVTIIEFLSPTNKQGEGVGAFRAKRAELLASGVNVVEVDLVRGGNWRAVLRPHDCPPEWSTSYRVTIRVPSDPAAVYLLPITLRERLPEIAIPLRAGDDVVRLDLQALIDHAYVGGRYAKRLNYKRPPEIALDQDDAAWANQLLRASGHRGE